MDRCQVPRPPPPQYSQGVLRLLWHNSQELFSVYNRVWTERPLYVVTKSCCLTHLQPSKDRWLLIVVRISVWLAVCELMNQLINYYITWIPGTVNVIDCLIWLSTPQFHRRPCDPATPDPKFFFHTATPSRSLRLQEWAWYPCDTTFCEPPTREVWCVG